MDPIQEREDEQRWKSSRRHHYFLTATCIVLAIAVVSLALYAYPILKRHDASLGYVPALSDSLNTLRDQMRADLKDANRKGAELGQDLRAKFEVFSKRASQSAEEAYKKLETRLDTEVKTRTDGVAGLTDRVSNLEKSRSADQTQIAQLKDDLNQVRNQSSQEAAAQAEPVEPVVQKIPFEATKDHNRDLGGGISLYVSDADVSHGQVSGWMWVASDHRNIWLRGQGTQDPVIFYGDQDGQKREIVFTDVTKNSVTGYLVLPKDASQTAAAQAGAGGQ